MNKSQRKKALLKKIRELKEQFKEHQSNKIVEIPNTDVEPILKRSIKGRPKLPDDQKKTFIGRLFQRILSYSFKS